MSHFPTSEKLRIKLESKKTDRRPGWEGVVLGLVARLPGLILTFRFRSCSTHSATNSVWLGAVTGERVDNVFPCGLHLPRTRMHRGKSHMPNNPIKFTVSSEVEWVRH